MELDTEIVTLAQRLEEALPEDEMGLVEEYTNLMGDGEAKEEDVLYWQGFVDGARLLWGETSSNVSF